MSDTIQAALVNALAEMPNPVKNSDNPAFKRGGKPLRYADLEATLDACKPVLAKHGLAVMQHPFSDERGIGVHTWLVGHGEVMDCGRFVLPLSKQDPQGAGSAITYARRYALTSLFGLAQEDDDANAASTKQQQKPAPSVRTQQVKAAIATNHSTDAVKAKLAEWRIKWDADVAECIDKLDDAAYAELLLIANGAQEVSGDE